MTTLLAYSITEANRLSQLDGERWVVAQSGAILSTLKSQSPIGGLAGTGIVVHESTPPALPTPSGLQAMYLGGRIADGRGRSKGKVVHWCNGGASALCGKEYGRRSAGWFTTNEAVNCAKCLRMAREQGTTL